MPKQHPIVIEDGDKAPAHDAVVHSGDTQPPAEDELGGGDICSVEETPSTDDDKPLN